jgi:hypothetical protein
MGWRLLVVPVVAAVVFGVEVLLSFRGRYAPPPVPRPPLEGLALPSYVVPPQEVGRGPLPEGKVVLVDTAHANRYDPQEIEVLLRHLTERGVRLEYLGHPTPRGTFLPAAQRAARLEERTRYADAFLTVAPADPFTPEEVETLQRFVHKGGRILLVGDPHRPDALNSLANAFGITFGSDYLYNLKEHGGNYQYVFFTRFTPDPLTAGLQRLTLFGAGSLRAPVSLVLADENTFSSTKERYEVLSPMGKDVTGRVVAVADLTFLGEPWNAFTDNDRFIANLADFLTGGRRVFTLADFPFFFRGDVDVVAEREELLPHAMGVQALLARPEREVRLQSREDFGRDRVLLVLFSEKSRVAPYTSSVGVEIDHTRITTPLAPPLERKGAGLILLASSGGRHVLVLMAEDAEGIGVLVERLRSGAFRRHLVHDMLGLYPDVRP